MKARVKCSGVIVTLPEGVAIDRSYYDELHDEAFQVTAPTGQTADKPKKRKRK